ncbi:MAG TPA: membrane or secreted protein [Chryseosolibacter sp.]
MKGLFTFLLLAGFGTGSHAQLSDLVGAWKYESGDTTIALIITNGHFAETTYSLKNKTFISTAGGSWSTQNGHFRKLYEFSSNKPELVGQKVSFYYHEEVKGKLGMVEESTQKKKEFTIIDNGAPGKLAGAWLITGRMQGGSLQSITPGARRTMKILSGTRFQWIAYNTDTKEFLGTGGGTYTTENGKYTENIEFFSRDNSRVGASLTFDFSLEDGNWRHKGLSSKGDPIDEVWTKREKIGL